MILSIEKDTCTLLTSIVYQKGVMKSAGYMRPPEHFARAALLSIVYHHMLHEIPRLDADGVRRSYPQELASGLYAPEYVDSSWSGPVKNPSYEYPAASMGVVSQDFAAGRCEHLRAQLTAAVAAEMAIIQPDVAVTEGASDFDEGESDAGGDYDSAQEGEEGLVETQDSDHPKDGARQRDQAGRQRPAPYFLHR